MDCSDGLCLKEHKKGNGRTRNQTGKKNFPDLDNCHLGIKRLYLRNCKFSEKQKQTHNCYVSLWINIKQKRVDMN